MPVIIMKTDHSPIYQKWVRPHAVWEGSYKEAIKWCNEKNDNKRNMNTTYDAVKVKTEKLEPNN